MFSKDEIKDIVREVIREELSLREETLVKYRILDKKDILIYMELNEKIIGNIIKFSI
jgi:hypothetical protein